MRRRAIALVALVTLVTSFVAPSLALAVEEEELEKALELTSPGRIFDRPAVGDEPREDDANRALMLQALLGRYSGYRGTVDTNVRRPPPRDELFDVGVEAQLARDCSSIDFKTYLDDYFKDELDEIAEFFSSFTDLDALLSIVTALGLAYLEPTIEEIMSKMRFQAMGRLGRRMNQCQAVKALREAGVGESMIGRGREWCQQRLLAEGEPADIAASVCSTAGEIGTTLGSLRDSTTSFFDAATRTYRIGDEIRYALEGPEPTDEQRAAGQFFGALMGDIELRFGGAEPEPGEPVPPPPGMQFDAPEIAPRDLYDASYTAAHTGCLEYEQRVRDGATIGAADLDEYLNVTSTPDYMLWPSVMEYVARDERHLPGWFCQQWADAVARDRVRSVGLWLEEQARAALAMNTKIDDDTAEAVLERTGQWNAAAAAIVDEDGGAEVNLARYFEQRALDRAGDISTGSGTSRARSDRRGRLADPLGIAVEGFAP